MSDKKLPVYVQVRIEQLRDKGSSAEEIAVALELPVADVKDHLEWYENTP